MAMLRPNKPLTRATGSTLGSPSPSNFQCIIICVGRFKARERDSLGTGLGHTISIDTHDHFAPCLFEVLQGCKRYTLLLYMPGYYYVSRFEKRAHFMQNVKKFDMKTPRALGFSLGL